MAKSETMNMSKTDHATGATGQQPDMPNIMEETVVLPPAGVQANAANPKIDAPGPIVESVMEHVQSEAEPSGKRSDAHSDMTAGESARTSNDASASGSVSDAASASDALASDAQAAAATDTQATAASTMFPSDLGDIDGVPWDIAPLEFPSATADDERPVSPANAADTVDAVDIDTGTMPALAMPDADGDGSAATAIVNPVHATAADDMPPAPPETQSGNRPVRRIAIIAAVVAVIIALAVGGFFYWRSAEQDKAHSAAFAACNASNSSVDDAKASLTKALDSSKKAQSVTSSQVADAATVSKLNSAVTSAQDADDASECSADASIAQLESATDKNTVLASSLKKHAETITAASKAVTESQTKKSIDDAKQKLSGEVTTAQTLLDQSAGAVADDATRTALQDAINAANTALGKSGVTADELGKALTALQDAEKNVQSSMQEYQTQQTQTQQNSNGYLGNNSYYGYNNYYGTNSGSNNNGSDNTGNTGNNGNAGTDSSGNNNGGNTTPTPDNGGTDNNSSGDNGNAEGDSGNGADTGN